MPQGKITKNSNNRHSKEGIITDGRLDPHNPQSRPSNKGVTIGTFFTTMQKDIYLCVDLETHSTKDKSIQVSDILKGTLCRDSEDHFTFTEHCSSKEPSKRPDRQWHPLAGSLHGKVSVNTNGSMLILYLRHEEYNTNSRQLADILVSEAEQIGDALADINMEEEVAKCGK